MHQRCGKLSDFNYYMNETFYRYRFRFVIPKVSTLSGFYESYIVISFDLAKIFEGEAPVFFLDGDWVYDMVSPISIS